MVIPEVVITQNLATGEFNLDFAEGTKFEYPQHRELLRRELREVVGSQIMPGVTSGGLAQAYLENHAHQHLELKTHMGTLYQVEGKWVCTEVSLSYPR